MDRWAEETTIGNWLRAQNVHSLRAFWGIVLEFVDWALKKAKPARVRRNGKLEVFFDDTQIEVEGRYYQGVAENYNGERSYCWQTLWVGPFVADVEWGIGRRDPSECLESQLETTIGLWEEAAAKVQRERLHEPSAAKEVFQTHRRKGAKEQGFHQLLGDMDLHHPPCLDSDANAFFYAIGALAFNLLMGVRVLLLDDA